MSFFLTIFNLEHFKIEWSRNGSQKDISFNLQFQQPEQNFGRFRAQKGFQIAT